MGLGLAGQMLRQRTPRRFRLRHRGVRFWRKTGGGGRLRLLRLGLLQIFQPQLQLFDLPLHLLRLAPELHPSQLAQQQLQSRDLTFPLLQLLLPFEQLLVGQNPCLMFGQQQSPQPFAI